MPFIAVLALEPSPRRRSWLVSDWTLHDATPDSKQLAALVEALDPVPDPHGGRNAAGLIPDLPTELYDEGRDRAWSWNQRTWSNSGVIVEGLTVRLELQTLDNPAHGLWRTHTNMAVTRDGLGDFGVAPDEQLMSRVWHVTVPGLLRESVANHIRDARKRRVQHSERCQVLLFGHTAEDLL